MGTGDDAKALSDRIEALAQLSRRLGIASLSVADGSRVITLTMGPEPAPLPTATERPGETAEERDARVLRELKTVRLRKLLGRAPTAHELEVLP